MGPLDLAAIAVYGAAVLAVGLLAGRGHGSAADLHLGGRRLPAWAVLCSLVATELSAATFIGVPHASFTGDWSYLQLAFGALLAKWLLAATVIPLYHRSGVVTVYGFLEDRFGPRARRSAAVCFAGGRVLASGVRLFIAALAFSAVTGARVETAIVACGLLAGAYTLAGGIRAVVWTDVLQGAVFLFAAVALLAALALRADGGLAEIWSWGAEAGRTRVFHLSPPLALSDASPLGVALLGGFFLTLATHATDHDMVQRLLTTRRSRGAAGALAGSALLNFPVTALFLFLGTGFAYVYATPPPFELGDGSRVLALFALHELPVGVRGVVFAGLFAAAMSSLDSAICAVATTWVVDVRPRPGDAAPRTRLASAVTCALLVAAALGMAAYHRALADGPRAGPSLVELALSAMTVQYGGLLGVFARAFLGRGRGSDRSAVAGLVVGAAAGLVLFLHPLSGRTWVAWSWWIPLAAALAFAVASIGPKRR